MALGPVVCDKCRFFGVLIDIGLTNADPYVCPKCLNCRLSFSMDISKFETYRYDMMSNSVFVTSVRKPFMYNDTPDPNDSYRVWLEEHVGKQGIHWDWELSRSDINTIDIAFIDKELAMLFTLVF